MKKLLSLRVWVAASSATCAAASVLLLTAGCATAPPVAERIMDVPMGTVTTFHRKSSGSLGTYDGKVVWTHAPATWAGRAVIAFGAPQAGVALHEPGSFGMLATLEAGGKPLMSYDPPIGYQWPLVVGKQWTSTHKVTLLESGRVVPLSINWKVESWGDVTVPAGTFKAYKLVWTTNQGEVETRWVSPQDGMATLRRHVERSGSHPQGPGVLDAELLSRVLPTP